MVEFCSAGPGGGCDGPTYTVFTEVSNFQISTKNIISNFSPETTQCLLGEQVPGLGGRTVWHGLPP